jgi:hypothetical protein
VSFDPEGAIPLAGGIALVIGRRRFARKLVETNEYAWGKVYSPMQAATVERTVSMIGALLVIGGVMVMIGAW